MPPPKEYLCPSLFLSSAFRLSCISSERRRKCHENSPNADFTLLAAVISCVHIVPFYILLTTSLKAKGDYSSKWSLPSAFSFQNFREAWERASRAILSEHDHHYSRFRRFVNFHGFACRIPARKKKYKAEQNRLLLLISIMIIPPLTSMVPLYKMVADAGLINTHAAAILINTAAYMPLTVFLYSGFIRSSIPKELEEAARMDGAGLIRTFIQSCFLC